MLKILNIFSNRWEMRGMWGGLGVCGVPQDECQQKGLRWQWPWRQWWWRWWWCMNMKIANQRVQDDDDHKLKINYFIDDADHDFICHHDISITISLIKMNAGASYLMLLMMMTIMMLLRRQTVVEVDKLFEANDDWWSVIIDLRKWFKQYWQWWLWLRDITVWLTGWGNLGEDTLWGQGSRDRSWQHCRQSTGTGNYDLWWYDGNHEDDDNDDDQ